MNEITQQNLPEVLKDLNERFFDIPFENSQFQNQNFIINAQLTGARAYRAIGLRMMSKIQAINELKYTRELEEIKLEKWAEKIANTETDKFKRRKLQAKIAHIRSGRDYSNKLLNDAISELNFLYAELQKLPLYTRELFESEEFMHFDLRFALGLKTGDAEKGTLTSLEAMSGNPIIKELMQEREKSLKNQVNFNELTGESNPKINIDKDDDLILKNCKERQKFLD